MSESSRVRTGSFIRIGLVLSVLMLVVGSIQFARYDWTGLPLQRAAASSDRVVSDDCLEEIRPYVTESGRTISPTVIDEQQYLSMIESYRGVPAEDAQVECFYSPFTGRVGTPWLASLLPVEEGLALGLVNTAFMLLGLWVVLATLRILRHDARTILAVGFLYAVGWNTLAFGTTLLVEPAPLAISALVWLALVCRRSWWAVPLVVVGLLFKETTAVLLVVLWADAVFGLEDFVGGDGSAGRDGAAEGRRGVRLFAPAAVATVAAGAVITTTSRLGPEVAAGWPAELSAATLAANLDPVGIFVLALGLGPLLAPSVLWWWSRRGEVGMLRATADPATIGVLCGLALLGWSALTADLSPRHFWLCFPFAATLTARWLLTGRARERLLGVRVPLWLAGRDPAP